MGRRSVLSGDPAEKTDRDTLEVIANLDPSPDHPAIGLRVTVRFEKWDRPPGLSKASASLPAAP
jgi:hypothetical protein